MKLPDAVPLRTNFIFTVCMMMLALWVAMYLYKDIMYVIDRIMTATTLTAAHENAGKLLIHMMQIPALMAVIGVLSMAIGHLLTEKKDEPVVPAATHEKQQEINERLMLQLMGGEMPAKEATEKEKRLVEATEGLVDAIDSMKE